MGIAKQVKVHFIDDPDDYFVNGFLLPNGNLICGVCGEIIEDSESYELVKVYKNWVDLNEFIDD